MKHRRRLRGLSAGMVALLFSGALAGCRGDLPQSGAVSGTGPGGPATGSASTGSGRVASSRSPLTGETVSVARPVLAVKIDNVGPARPQTGLSQADVVHVEPVEGGLSRILAVFSSRIPTRVGPVRSARESDLELLGEYGHPGLAFSGANKGVLAAIRLAPLVDLSQDQAPAGYFRSASRAAPHNLYADPQALIRGRGDLSGARDIGFTFGPVPAGGTPLNSRKIRYGAASTAFTWSSTRKRWTVSLDGRAATSTEAGRLTAATVVVQYTSITRSSFHDVLGNPTPFTHTVGSGPALILRDGQKFTARWSRPAADQPTRFTGPDGGPMPFATGPVWVVYAPESG
jgi:hypothetical protein